MGRLLPEDRWEEIGQVLSMCALGEEGSSPSQGEAILPPPLTTPRISQGGVHKPNQRKRGVSHARLRRQKVLQVLVVCPESCSPSMPDAKLAALVMHEAKDESGNLPDALLTRPSRPVSEDGGPHN